MVTKTNLVFKRELYFLQHFERVCFCDVPLHSGAV